MSVTVAFVCETAPGERRAALTPETCKKLLASKARVLIERGAGSPASFPDETYVGAECIADRAAILAQADILVCVQPPAQCRTGEDESRRGAGRPAGAAGRSPAACDALSEHADQRVLARAAAAHDARAGDGRAQFAGRHGRLQGGADRRAAGAALLPDADHGGRHHPSVEGADRRRRRRRPAGDRHGAPAGRPGRRLRRAAGNARTDRIARRQVPRPRRHRRGRGRLCPRAHRRGTRRTAASPGRTSQERRRDRRPPRPCPVVPRRRSSARRWCPA